MFSLSCSSSKAANVPKPVTSGIASSQIRIAFEVAGRRNAELLHLRTSIPRSKWLLNRSPIRPYLVP